jgi:GNAT superfamily N-acetyltransferase
MVKNAGPELRVEPQIRVSCPPHQTVNLEMVTNLKDRNSISLLELQVSPVVMGGKIVKDGEHTVCWAKIPRMFTREAHRNKGYMRALLDAAKNGAGVPGGLKYIVTSWEDSTEQGKCFLRNHGFKRKDDLLVWEKVSRGN